ncbi:MAG: glycosyl hydrolase, partial [Verrucomicrobiota bacterium]
MNFTRLVFASASLSLALVVSAAPSDSLEKGFLNPPDSAKPQTWWHWMNGNISKAGITADLEAMKEIGLGGATIVNVDCGIPRGDVPFMSPAWREDFKFAIQEAHRLGLDMTVENCAGWSSSGGPWNTPEHAMQTVTVSELRVTGPMNFHAALPQPPMKLDFYRDIAVLAFPVPAAESAAMTEAAPVASLSSGSSDARKILDGNQNTLVRLPAPRPGKPQFAQLEFARPFAARGVRIVGASPMPECHGDILVSDDGKNFRVLKSFAYGRRATATRLVTIDGAQVAARFWRVQFTGLDGRAATATIPLAEVELTSRLSIGDLEPKAGFAGYSVPESKQTDTSSAGAIPRRDIIELTSKVSADGTLHWQVPDGQWVIQRFGYTPIGVKNHPAPEEGTGLECDKMSKEALQAHWDGFMQKVLDDVGPLAGKTLSTSLIDSYEVGCQNWTKEFRAEFKKRRGYDLLTFLPTFTGCVVENPAVSERFLWDVRRTIADLFAENYFG